MTGKTYDPWFSIDDPLRGNARAHFGMLRAIALSRSRTNANWKDGSGERTVFNRFSYVYMFLKRYRKAGIVRKNDWPKFEETEAEIYRENDVTKMPAACERVAERALILFASDTGFRHGEIAHAEVTDIDMAEGVIRTALRKPSARPADHPAQIFCCVH